VQPIPSKTQECITCAASIDGSTSDFFFTGTFVYNRFAAEFYTLIEFVAFTLNIRAKFAFILLHKPGI